MSVSDKRQCCLLTASLLLGLLSGLLSSSLAAQTTLVIEGVGGELAENIRLLVAQPPAKSSDRQFRRYLNDLPAQAVSALSAYGYYAAEVNVSVKESATPRPATTAGRAVEDVENAVKGVDGKKQETTQAGTATAKGKGQSPEATTQILINVTANEPVRIETANIQINTLDKKNTDFNAVLSQIRRQLGKGKVFISGDYETAKSSILNTAQELGYFDFEYSRTEVRVSRRAKTATITLIADAGVRFTFGDIRFQQRTFSDIFLNRWLPFTPGDPYQSELIGELTENLQSSGYFASVRVRPLVDPRYGQSVPVIVDLAEQQENQVAVGIGYSTDTEFRTTLNWSKPLLNSRGHSAQWGVSLARDTQTASFAYRIPRTKTPLFNYWGIEYGLKNDRDGDVDSFLSTLNFQRATRTSSNWNESLFLRWERERFNIGGVERTTNLVLPGVSYSRSRSRGQPFPTWGQALTFQLMAGSKSVLSSIDFLKAEGQFRYLRAVSERNTLIGSIQYGAIHSNNFDKVPTSQRFFAGGDNTVRGFAFRDISPRNPDGESVGGRFLEVLSLEYDYRFRDLWSAAVFTDAGRAFNSFSTAYSIGAGVGLRWQSPVGPFRVDLAVPVTDTDNETDSGGLRFHLSLGADF